MLISFDISTFLASEYLTFDLLITTSAFPFCFIDVSVNSGLRSLNLNDIVSS